MEKICISRYLRKEDSRIWIFFILSRYYSSNTLHLPRTRTCLLSFVFLTIELTSSETDYIKFYLLLVLLVNCPKFYFLPFLFFFSSLLKFPNILMDWRSILAKLFFLFFSSISFINFYAFFIFFLRFFHFCYSLRLFSLLSRPLLMHLSAWKKLCYHNFSSRDIYWK